MVQYGAWDHSFACRISRSEPDFEADLGQEGLPACF
jgi:hypothetical protein